MEEINVIGQMNNSDGTFESANRVYGVDGISPTIPTCGGGGLQPKLIECKVIGGSYRYLEIKQATKEGSIPCEIGGVADLNYPNSTTRRGRVQGKGQICPTLTTESIPSVIEPWTWEIDGIKYLIRIRKLTPKECWRLMDFKDEDFQKAEKVNSNTQLYKQAGNSIVKNVLCEVFKQLIG